jgi:hypothetical protein
LRRGHFQSSLLPGFGHEHIPEVSRIHVGRGKSRAFIFSFRGAGLPQAGAATPGLTGDGVGSRQSAPGALAPREFLDGCFQVGYRKVRPALVEEDELSKGAFP